MHTHTTDGAHKRQEPTAARASCSPPHTRTNASRSRTSTSTWHHNVPLRPDGNPWEGQKEEGRSGTQSLGVIESDTTVPVRLSRGVRAEGKQDKGGDNGQEDSARDKEKADKGGGLLRLSSMDFFSADDVQGSDRGAAQRSALALSLAATLPPPGAHTPTRASAQGAHRDAPRDLGPDTGREGVGDLHGHAALAQERALSNRLRLLLVPSLACLALAPANPQMSASLSPASVPLHQRVRVSKRLTGHARRPRACRMHARVCACVRTHMHTRAHIHTSIARPDPPPNTRVKPHT